MAGDARISVRPPSLNDSRLYDVWLNGEDVTWSVRDPEVGAIVSRVAEHPAVRAALLPLQRTIASGGPVVMVGRDIGTVVVPDAGLKVYLDATPEERARRRFREAAARGSSQTFEAVLRETLQRDATDRGRDTAPLRPALDAVQINTDGVPIDQIVDEIEVLARAGRDEMGNPLAVVSATNSEGAPANLLTGTIHGRPRTILRAVVLAVLRPLIALRLIGVENVPCDGPLLVASNHLSNADPIILEAAFPRPLFSGEVRAFPQPRLSLDLAPLRRNPVERGTPDRAAIRRARTVLEQGIALAIYPEGVRSRTAALVKGLPGAGLIALQSGALVLPVGIYGTEFFPVNGEVPPRRPKAYRAALLCTSGPQFAFPSASTESESRPRRRLT